MLWRNIKKLIGNTKKEKSYILGETDSLKRPLIYGYLYSHDGRLSYLDVRIFRNIGFKGTVFVATAKKDAKKNKKKKKKDG